MLSFACDYEVVSGLGRKHGKGAEPEQLGPPCDRQGLSTLDNYQFVSPERGGDQGRLNLWIRRIGHPAN